MKRFNLIPKQGRKAQAAPPAAGGRKRPKANILLIITLLAVIIIAAPNALNRRSGEKLAVAKARLEEAKKELGRRQSQRVLITKDYDLFVKKKLAAEEKLQYLKDAETGKPAELSQALAYMPALMPEEIWINKLSVEGRRVVINGSTLDNQAVSRFIENLNRSNKFKNSSFNFTQKGELGDATLYNFEIAAQMAN